MRLAKRFLLAAAAGLAAAGLATLRLGEPSPGSRRPACFAALRAVRHALEAYESVNGRPPALRGGEEALDGREFPVNPFTRSRAIALVPRGEVAERFASGSKAGWAYLPGGGSSERGRVPPGFVLPCGADGASDLGFEIEDRVPWQR